MKAPERPNILLITTDQQRYDALGINGNGILETPNLDSLAARGVNFSRCYITCPVCIPARRTWLSGQHPTTHGLRHYEDGLDFDPPFTLPSLLRDAGYQTQLVGKLHMHPMGKRYGFDHMVLSETSHWRPTSRWQPRNDYVRWLRQHGVQEHPHLHGINGNGRLVAPWPLEDRFHQNNFLAGEAARFLCEDRDPESPFFLHLSFFHPHPPLVPTRDYFDRYLAKSIPEPKIGEWAVGGDVRSGIAPDSAVGPFDPEMIQRATAAYYALINHIDDCVAYVLERWREYGNDRAKQPLYVIFSSDHGEMLGDHHLFRKSLGYEASSHVPFFISGFNVDLPAGTTRDDLCCWEDLLPTVADLADIEVPSPVDGHSLFPGGKTREPSPHRDHLYGLCNGQHSNHFIVHGPWKYIWFPATNEEQLFHLGDDPCETSDLSANLDLLQPLRERMAAAPRHPQDPPYEAANLKPCRNQTPQVFLT
ncbi:MAG: sulfatase-like hydrolase/transferase [Oceanipulchritudo sp.]